MKDCPESSNSFVYKKSIWKWALYSILLREICDGMELSIIVPSIQDHMIYDYDHDKQLDTKNFSVFWASRIFIAYFSGSIISMLIFGYLRDKYFNSRPLILFCCFTSILGNLVFILAPSIPFLVLGRFLAGITIGVLFQSDVGKHAHLTIGQKSYTNALLYFTWHLGQILGTSIQGFISKLKLDFAILGYKKITQNNVGIILVLVLYSLSGIFTFVTYRSEFFIIEDYERLHHGNIVSDDKSSQINDKTPLKTDKQTENSNLSIWKILKKQIIYTTLLGLTIDGFFQATIMNMLLPTLGNKILNFDQSKVSWILTSVIIIRMVSFYASGVIRPKYFGKNSIRYGIALGSILFLTCRLALNFWSSSLERVSSSNLLSKQETYATSLIIILILSAIALPFLITSLIDTTLTAVPKKFQGIFSGIKLIVSSLGYLSGYLVAGEMDVNDLTSFTNAVTCGTGILMIFVVFLGVNFRRWKDEQVSVLFLNE